MCASDTQAFTCTGNFFSPFIVWVTLAINRELIHYLVNASWLATFFPDAVDALREDVNSRWFISGFNQSALSGLLTLYGVIVTVSYYHITRQQEVVEKRLFIIEELLEELNKNRRIWDGLNKPSEPLPATGKLLFSVGTWERLGADVALLPRRLHMRLSVLYSCLGECVTLEDYQSRRATLERLPDIILELKRFRGKLSKQDLS